MRLCLLLMLCAETLFASAAGDLIATEARANLGVKYGFGRADTKRTDCAGLVRRVAAKAGVDLPRSSAAQFSAGRAIEAADLKPGDLVFFKNTYRRGISHVGIYVGDGEFVHAASHLGRVAVARIDEPYFAKRYAGARRVVVEDEQPPIAADAACPLESAP